jgi:hypothetical protein
MGLLDLPDGVRTVIVHHLRPSDGRALSSINRERPFSSELHEFLEWGGVKRERSMGFLQLHLRFCERQHHSPKLLILDLSGADLSSGADLGEVLERCINVRALRLVGCSLLQPQVTALARLLDPKAER